ncbi:hypothetical protein TWF102_007221 [Orbilia oligospora]|uniref:Uncharacterized protein n=1 Tax=Orbilia oligospora TaxID=2813651 RepID=A0A7C8J814_ORBOL|nr:hypothetical protein TWF102_007221 [Orbilia oligospora]KAF3102830.1 hypothetical protein TWF103_007533 [Orbilia oligospora]KAF3113117.1 hypothetical protein TWF706_010117 [Orbilia oligospora]
MPERLAAWTPETDRVLLLAIIATTGSPSLPTIASFTGYSLNSLIWRFRTLKKEAASLQDKSQETSSRGKFSPPTSRKRANTGSDRSSLIKKRKTSSTKGGKRKNPIFHDTSDEEPPTPVFTESEEEEEEGQTPSLHDDDEDETDTSFIEPVTPTKPRPQRKAKPAPGYYKLLDEGSEPEFEEGEADESQSE